MSKMNTVIVSDVHIGSKYFHQEEFIRFVKNMPEGCALVLNGDIVSRWHKHLSEQHRTVLDFLREESFNRPVIWIRGNHDDGYVAEDPGDIEFRESYSIGKRLFVSHGYDFDNVMPHNRTFIMLFRMMHHLRIRLGAEAMHVAFYAKKWARLYRVLRKHVAMNAVEHAKENGFEAVTCGHTHYVEDLMIDGIRYINTGSWTEHPMFYLSVNEKDMKLEQVPSS